MGPTQEALALADFLISRYGLTADRYQLAYAIMEHEENAMRDTQEQSAPVVSTPVEATGLVSTDEAGFGSYPDAEDSREVGSAYRCAATPAQPAPVVGGDARKDWVVVPMNPSPSVLDYLLIPTLGNWHGMLALCPVPPKLAARPGGEGTPIAWRYSFADGYRSQWYEMPANTPVGTEVIEYQYAPHQSPAAHPAQAGGGRE